MPSRIAQRSRKTPKKTSKRVVLYVPDTFDPDIHLPLHLRHLAWIPMEEERPNENASALPENSNIFALSAPWSLCGSKSYRGVSREVSRSIVYSAFVVQLSFRPGKIGIRRS